MDGLSAVAAGFAAGDRPVADRRQRVLRLRPRPSRPDPGRRHRPLDPRSRSRGRLRRSIFRRSVHSVSEESAMARHTFFCIDGHTCGNPVRLVAGGGPLLNGATMMERRAHFLAEYDWIRTGLMFEPRGHDVMSGSILYPPTRADCDIAILFIETSGCLPMCGHGTIGTVTMAIEHGLVQAEDAGRAAPRHAGRAGDRRVPAGRRICRGGAHHQRAVLPLCRGADGRVPGARRDQGRRRLWRQFLRHRRAAGELPRHGRSFRRRADRLEPGGARSG